MYSLINRGYAFEFVQTHFSKSFNWAHMEKNSDWKEVSKERGLKQGRITDRRMNHKVIQLSEKGKKNWNMSGFQNFIKFLFSKTDCGNWVFPVEILALHWMNEPFNL